MRRMTFVSLALIFSGVISAQDDSGIAGPVPAGPTPTVMTGSTTTIVGRLVSRSGHCLVVEKDWGARLPFVLDGRADVQGSIGRRDRAAVTIDALDGYRYHTVGLRLASKPRPEANLFSDFAPIGMIMTGTAAGPRALGRRSV